MGTLYDDLKDFLDEIREAQGEITTLDWRLVADAIAAKMAIAASEGGVTSWSFGGRTVTKSLSELRHLHAIALAQANRQRGGLDYMPLRFV